MTLSLRAALLAFTLLTLGTTPALCAQPPAWASAAAERPAPDAVPGWRCQQLLRSELLAATWAVCRSDSGASSGLQLLQLEQGGTALQRPMELARLGDASQARLRLLTPPQRCSSAPCIDALLLLDQRDESSCYGSQVLVLVPGRPLRSVGFIDDLRQGEDELACTGATASVRGQDAMAQITLTGPLVRMGRDGKPRPSVPAGMEVSYHVDTHAAVPTLKRQPPRRPTP